MTVITYFFYIICFVIKIWQKMHLEIGVFLNRWNKLRTKRFTSCYRLQILCLSMHAQKVTWLLLLWPSSDPPSSQVWLLPSVCGTVCMCVCVWGRHEGPWQQLDIVGGLMNEEEIKMVNHELWAFSVELYFRALCPSVSMHSWASRALFSPQRCGYYYRDQRRCLM